MNWQERLRVKNCLFDNLAAKFRLIVLCCACFLPKDDLMCQMKFTSSDLDSIINRSSAYIIDQQFKVDSGGGNYKGEWPSYMQMMRPFLLLGSCRNYYDSNAFTTLAIHNSLAESVSSDSSLNFLKPALSSAFECVQAFESSGQYNFWRLLKPNRIDLLGDSILVRRPTNFKLGSGFINNAANVVNDADDTSAGELAEYYQFKLGLIDNNPMTRDSYNQVYLRYTDKGRCNLHWYNFLKDGKKHFGAYMTWLGEERCIPKGLYLLRTIADNFIFLLPKSRSYPIPGKPYMPYGANDLDAIVNCNVLLARANTIAEGNMCGSDSCAVKYITRKVRRKRWSTAGIYYPNRYAIHYFLSRAYKAGLKDLEEAKELCISHLLESQNSDGSYTGRRRVKRGDPIQNTTYAVLALLNMGDSNSADQRQALDRAITFLLENAKKDSLGNFFWDAGVYFSGGTVIRNNLFFSSESLTTALILEALVKYRKLAYT